MRTRGEAMTDESADKQAAEKLVEALMKIGATMTAISNTQTAMAELLQAIHAEQQAQRAAMVRLAQLIEARTERPN
jgi:hypothetical protein